MPSLSTLGITPQWVPCHTLLGMEAMATCGCESSVIGPWPPRALMIGSCEASKAVS